MKTEIFDLHPDLEVYYQSSDGVQFFNPNDAALHAKTLQDKTVATIRRDDDEPMQIAAEPQGSIDELTAEVVSIPDSNLSEAASTSAKNETKTVIPKKKNR